MGPIHPDKQRAANSQHHDKWVEGIPEPAKLASMALDRGMFQVYPPQVQLRLNSLLAEVFHMPRLAVFGGDWRGTQYFIEESSANQNQHDPVYQFDPSAMYVDDIGGYGQFLERVLDGTIVNEVEPTDFAAWLLSSRIPNLAIGQCAPPILAYFRGGNEEYRVLEPADVVVHIESSLREFDHIKAKRARL